MVDISVIVPVYNVEQYLRVCLESLVHQTHPNIEIIIVNDASPDHSDEIMLEYGDKYHNIKNIFLKENLCLGGARNQGVLAATGKYIMFIDSDDSIDLNYCEKLMEVANQEDSDVVYASYKIVNESGEVSRERYMYPTEFAGQITENIRRGVINKGAYAWGKLFRRSLWLEHQIAFPEHLKYEDAPTIPLFFLYANRASFVDDIYYYYLKRSSSITGQKNVSYPMDAQTTAKLFVTRMKERNLYDAYQEEIEHFVTERYYSVFIKRCLTMFDTIPCDMIEETKENMMTMYPQYTRNKYIGMFVAEDLLRMKMCEISVSAVIEWEQKYKAVMTKDHSLEASIYYDTYKEKESYIGQIVSGQKRVTLYGQSAKKEALKRALQDMYMDVNINEDMEQVLPEEKIIVVNPGSCIGLKSFRQSNTIINFEDFIHGYIEY